MAIRCMSTPSSSPLLRRGFIGLLLAAGVSLALAAEQHRYYVSFAAVLVPDPSVVDVRVESIGFSFHEGRYEKGSDAERHVKKPFAHHSERFANAKMLFWGGLLSPDANELPASLGSISVRWALDGSAHSTYEAVVPLDEYRNSHNFLHSHLLISVQPSGLLVELLEDKENKFKKFYRCWGSSFSASGACGVRPTLVTLGTIAAMPVHPPPASKSP